MANQKKSDIIADVTKSLENGANFALITFEKSTHKSLEDLRNELRKSNAKINVVKNTLFEKAVNKLAETEKEFSDVRKNQFPLKNKIAIMSFKGDWMGAVKAYFDFTKKAETFGFKFGKIDNIVYGDRDLVRLAELPSKEQLIAKLTGTMKNPMARTTRALTSNMQKLVYILSSKAQAN